MKTKVKRSICIALAWLAFFLMLGVVGGVERDWMPLSAMWWSIPCLLVWAGGLWKAGWVRVG